MTCSNMTAPLTPALSARRSSFAFDARSTSYPRLTGSTSDPRGRRRGAMPPVNPGVRVNARVTRRRSCWRRALWAIRTTPFPLRSYRSSARSGRHRARPRACAVRGSRTGAAGCVDRSCRGCTRAHEKAAHRLVDTYVSPRDVGPVGRSIGGGSPVHPGHHTIAPRRRCGLLNAPSGPALSPLTGLRGGAALSLLLAPDAGANNGR